MPVALTDKECDMLSAVISNMDGVPAVDWDKIKDVVGVKYARNARASFVRTWDKLRAGNGDSTSADSTTAAGNGAIKTTVKKQAAPRKTGPRKAPHNAGAETGKRGKKVKKQESDDDEEMTPNMKEEDRDDDDDENPEESDDGKFHSLSPSVSQCQDDDHDEEYEQDCRAAALLDVTVEEYRSAGNGDATLMLAPLNTVGSS
ncbi:MAG: hypothetical protein M1818_002377 [Claussenomyces sp. TS43310]|nr:MAG: hypothetical protein M1818_002377 [Claussenomyces sp. TS43310]